MILAGGKYLEIKASLHLFHESILFLDKDKNQVLARSRSENENSFKRVTQQSRDENQVPATS